MFHNILRHLTVDVFQINPCTAAGNPCQNEASCVALQQGRYKCECLPGWEGQHCEINTGEYFWSKNMLAYVVVSNISYIKYKNVILMGGLAANLIYLDTKLTILTKNSR